MADINLKDLFDLDLTGTKLFDDLKNFMVELSDDNELIIGGMRATTGQGTTVCCVTDKTTVP